MVTDQLQHVGLVLDNQNCSRLGLGGIHVVDARKRSALLKIKSEPPVIPIRKQEN
jgi:hypothetical protein